MMDLTPLLHQADIEGNLFVMILFRVHVRALFI
jgi:hypothetical protein